MEDEIKRLHERIKSLEKAWTKEEMSHSITVKERNRANAVILQLQKEIELKNNGLETFRSKAEQDAEQILRLCEERDECARLALIQSQTADLNAQERDAFKAEIAELKAENEKLKNKN